MAKISELADGGNLLNDDELIVLRAGGNVRATVANLPEVDASGNMSFADNEKANFGAGSDLQIYHDGSHSYIEEKTSGNLYIKGANLFLQSTSGESYAYFSDNGAARLYYDNVKKFETTSTGVDVTGTVTADGLTVDGNATISGASNGLRLTETDTTNLNSYITNQAGTLRFRSANDAYNSFTTRIQLDHATGDVSFYEDTGTTAKFRWDASAESLGIGTTVPQHNLDILSETNANASARIEGGSNLDSSLSLTESGNSGFKFTYDGGDNKLYIGSGTSGTFTTRMTVERDSGNVGIGTTSPDSLLHVNGTGSGNGTFGPSFTLGKQNGPKLSVTQESTDNDVQGLAFFTKNSATLADPSVERMRIDSSGNVGIGTTSPGSELEVVGRIATSGGSADIQSNLFGAGDGSASNPSIRHLNDSDTGFWFPAANTIGFSTAGSEAMRIDSSGNVGIGTSSPVTDLDVQGSSIVQKSTSTDLTIKTARYMGYSYNNNLATMMYGYFSDTGNSVLIGGATSSGEAATSLQFYTTTGVGTTGGGSERMRIDSNGNVGIGTGSPARKLHVDGQAQATQLWLDNGSNTNAGIRRNGNDLELITYAGYGINLMPSSNKVGIGTTAPSSALHVSTSSAGSIELARFRNEGQTNNTGFFFSTDETTKVSEIDASGGTAGNALALATSGVEKVRIDHDGNVGIGTSSPEELLHTNANSTGEVITAIFENGTNAGGTSTSIRLRNSTDNCSTVIESNRTGANFGADFVVRNSDSSTGALQERFRITEAGNVGIGTGSPAALLHLESASPVLRLTDSDTGADSIISATSSVGALSISADNGDEVANSYINFKVDGAETMRIDTSGNLLVGKTSASSSIDGAELKNGNGVSAIIGTSSQSNAASGNVMILNRRTTDGEIVNLRKDGTTVGSIGSYANARLFIGSGSSFITFNENNNNIYPATSSGTASDNTLDLGSPTARFKDLYLSGSLRSDSISTTESAITFINSTDALHFGGGQFRPFSADDAVIDLGGSAQRFKDLYLSGGAYLGGTAAANQLDDYEEGTWTPVYTPETGSFTTLTMEVVSASYTKVGNLVTISAFIRTDDVDVTGASGDVRVTGLPFLPTGYSPIAVGSTGNWSTTGYHPTAGYIFNNGGTGTIQLKTQTAAGGAQGPDITVSDFRDGTVSNANTMTISGTYFTNA